MEDPPPILIIYCGANNIPLQHGAKSIELRLCIINIFTLWFRLVGECKGGRNPVALEKVKKVKK